MLRGCRSEFATREFALNAMGLGLTVCVRLVKMQVGFVFENVAAFPPDLG